MSAARIATALTAVLLIAPAAACSSEAGRPHRTPLFAAAVHPAPVAPVAHPAPARAAHPAPAPAPVRRAATTIRTAPAAASRSTQRTQLHPRTPSTRAHRATIHRRTAVKRISRSEKRTALRSKIAARYGARAFTSSLLSRAQYKCFSAIVERESGWNHRATNPSSGAYGIPQALPGSKMRSAGADWRTNPATQIKWALRYMNSRYGSPCGAWSFWQSHRWY